MVSSNPVPAIPKVEAIYPPPWLVKTTGTKLSQFLTFIFAAVKRQPDIVGGFHMMPHGAAAAVASRLTGARSMYFSVGGPAEIRDGGVHSSDSPFNKMETPDAVVEDRFLNLIGNFDTIITMGSGAINYLLEKGIETDYHVAAGGIDAERFKPNESATSIDIILTGRLTYIKRLDIFLSAIRKVADELPEVRVVIVGSGELQADLMQAALTLGIDDNVHFAGYQENVEDWLSRSKIFVLTSDSEGLALSMMEAMMSGLPAVVYDVVDLGDLVESGVNGYLVPRRSPQLFADRLIELLSDRQKLHAFSQAARRSALRYETQATIEKWDMIFSRYR
jgi:glycosyltransferase involved in cell wall biosynthesis